VVEVVKMHQRVVSGRFERFPEHKPIVPVSSSPNLSDTCF
jgi:hypothetical protein